MPLQFRNAVDSINASNIFCSYVVAFYYPLPGASSPRLANIPPHVRVEDLTTWKLCRSPPNTFTNFFSHECLRQICTQSWKTCNDPWISLGTVSLCAIARQVARKIAPCLTYLATAKIVASQAAETVRKYYSHCKVCYTVVVDTGKGPVRVKQSPRLCQIQKLSAWNNGKYVIINS